MSEELSTLLRILPTQINDFLSKSITGDTLDFVVVRVIGINKDFAALNSFVSFTGEHTILVVSKSKFSFKGIETAVDNVEKELSEPAGLVPVVVLIFALIVVSGNSNAPIRVLIVSYL